MALSDCLYHTDNRQAVSLAGFTLRSETSIVYPLSDLNAPLNLACLYVVRQLVYSFFKHFFIAWSDLFVSGFKCSCINYQFFCKQFIIFMLPLKAVFVFTQIEYWLIKRKLNHDSFIEANSSQCTSTQCFFLRYHSIYC